MGFTTKAAVAGLLIGAAQAFPAHNNGTGVVYTTEIVTAITTYCPAATTLTHGDKTYTVTEATTLTITDCPCTISKPVAPTSSAPPAPHMDECAKACWDKYNECRVAPDSNKAYCAAQLAKCVNYNPFASSPFVTPTACSEAPKPTLPTEPAHTYYTTEVVTAITTYCPEPTTLTYGNKTVHVTVPGTITVTDCPCTISKPHTQAPPAPSAVKDCAEECTEKYNECRGKPDANFSSCAAAYAQCLGYNPFGADGSLIKPTACHPEASGPAPSGPAATHPAGSAPAPSGPAPTHPAGSAPAPSQPAGSAPPSGPAPPASQPAGSAPAPSEPAASNPAASNPTAPAVVPTESGATPVGTNPPQVTGAAGRIAPAGILAAVGFFALF